MSQARGLSKHDLEEGSVFAPKFDSTGLIGAIVTDTAGGGVLMFAYMNGEALRLTLETGEAHFWSRSRAALWRKGETSGATGFWSRTSAPAATRTCSGYA